MNYRTVIQYLIVATSYPPFSYLYGKIYDFSVTVAVALLRQVDGVVTIYLRRGMAQGEITYGLSDIDLLVIVSDKEDSLVKAKIKAIYNRFSIFIPLYGSGDRELGVYSLSEFISLYHDYKLYRYRFNEGKYTWRLLFGEDTVKMLPDIEDSDLYLPATEELKVWWVLLSAEMNSDFNYHRFQRKYLWYKAISEAAKICLFICQGKKIRNRGAALHEIKQYIPAEYREQIETVRRYSGNLNNKEEVDLPSLLNMFVFLVSKTYEEVASKVLAGKTGKRATFYLPDTTELGGCPGLSDHLAEFFKDYKEELEPYCTGMAVIPQLEFDDDVLNNSDIDSFYLLIFQRNTIPIEILRKIHYYFEQNGNPQNIEPFVVFHDKLAFSLQSDRPYTCIKTAWINPEIFSLASACMMSSGEGLSCRTDVRSLHCILPSPLFEETILKRIIKIDSLLLDKNIHKVKILELLRFFWASARTKMLACSLESEDIIIPISSAQIFQGLLELYPNDADWLKCLHQEYNKEISGSDNEAFRSVARALDFIKNI